MALGPNAKYPRSMKGLCRFRRWSVGGIEAIWATIWATCDAARLVGLRALVRRIAARGRPCAGAACPMRLRGLTGCFGPGAVERRPVAFRGGLGLPPVGAP